MTIQELAKIFQLYYPELGFTAKVDSTGDVHFEVHNGEKPSAKELEKHLAAAQESLLGEKTQEDKEQKFQSKYPPQEQLLVLAQAIVTGDRTEVETMLNFYDSL